MRRECRMGVVCLALAMCGLTVAGCGGGNGGSAEAGPAGEETTLDLTIGTLLPLSGPLADFGPSNRKAADLALAQVNEAVAEAGATHTVDIRYEDDQSDPQAGVQVARDLVGAGAECLVGSFSSAVTIPVARSVTVREGVLQISPISTSDAITDVRDDGLLNRTAPPDSFQGPAVADLIATALEGAEGRKVNIGARNDAYGTGLAKTFREAWEKSGGVVGEEVIYDPEQPSYNSEAAQIVRGDPDAFAIFDFPETYGKMGPALVRTGGFDPSVAFGPGGLGGATLSEIASEEATEGLRGTVPGSPEGNEATEAFDELFREASGPERQVYEPQTFDAVVLCYLAAVAAGSTDGAEMAERLQAVSGPPGTEYTWQQLPEAIEALQNGEDIDYQGASGPIDLNEAGDPTAGVYDIYQHQGGNVEVIGEVAIQPVDTADSGGEAE